MLSFEWLLHFWLLLLHGCSLQGWRVRQCGSYLYYSRLQSMFRGRSARNPPLDHFFNKWKNAKQDTKTSLTNTFVLGHSTKHHFPQFLGNLLVKSSGKAPCGKPTSARLNHASVFRRQIYEFLWIYAEDICVESNVLNPEAPGHRSGKKYLGRTLAHRWMGTT